MKTALLSFLVGSTPLAVGDPAPDFTLPDQDGKPVTLSKLLASGPVILAFYPKAFTSGCTRQNSSFRDRYGDLAGKGAQVLGISTDDVATQKRFKEDLKLPYPLLSDKGGRVAKQYAGTMAVLGLANRANFVVGQDGKIASIVLGGDAVDPGSAIAACPARKGAP
jgi:peroxiredoxin Q/BCP